MPSHSPIGSHGSPSALQHRQSQENDASDAKTLKIKRGGKTYTFKASSQQGRLGHRNVRQIKNSMPSELTKARAEQKRDDIETGKTGKKKNFFSKCCKAGAVAFVDAIPFIITMAIRG